jgi:solute carrier family 1 (high affinity glutamate transporter) protein 1
VGFWPELQAIAAYAFTVIFGLLLHGFVALPLVLWLFAKRSPAKCIRALSEALLTAFSTASSSATFPLTYRCTTERATVSPRTASFVLPLGATVNMDGTALYDSVAAIFIAEAHGIPLSAPQYLIIFLTATLAAIGAAGIPEAGLVTMIIVLKAVGLPVEGIALILTIDWFLDRCRTTINVWSDAVGVGVIDRLEQGDGAPAEAA